MVLSWFTLLLNLAVAVKSLQKQYDVATLFVVPEENQRKAR